MWKTARSRAAARLREVQQLQRTRLLERLAIDSMVPPEPAASVGATSADANDELERKTHPDYAHLEGMAVPLPVPMYPGGTAANWHIDGNEQTFLFYDYE